jgi:hypothetical protein
MDQLAREEIAALLALGLRPLLWLPARFVRHGEGSPAKRGPEFVVPPTFEDVAGALL